jgi:asparagine synthase (glutamine-hydrolysing)
MNAPSRKSDVKTRFTPDDSAEGPLWRQLSMCGICGIISPRRDDDVSVALERLTERLRHRGPDDVGFRYLGGRWAGMGHRRLSIVDPAGGAQPMTGEDERIWVTFNGEIFNHETLRRELIALGHRFRTRADTEVLVHGFETWGTDLFARLNGIFAFALYDGRRDPREVWLVRDPVGAKPLYLGRHGGTWWFASELGAARASGLVDPELRPEAVDEFLVYRFIPSPGTPFQNTWKVPPGHFCRLPLDRLPDSPHFERFEPRFAPAVLPRTTAEWAEALRAGLIAAIERQLMSDVPVGVLLSGGVDSTALTRVMRDRMPEAPQAFGVGLAGHPARAELTLAREAARSLGIPLAEIMVTSDQYLAAWLDHVSHLGEPIANSGSLLVKLLCRTVGKTHKVVLTGQGADEPLGGYARHVAERFYPIARVLERGLKVLPESLGESDRIARMRRIARQSDPAKRFTDILAIFSPERAISLTGHDLDIDRLTDPVRRWLEPDLNHDSLNALLRVDARLSLADDLLLVADHMSMASSVELRVPFLDLELLALVDRMPSRYKVSTLGERKWLYRQAMMPLLPKDLRGALLGWNARTGRKLGFTTPIEHWFASWIERDAERYLLGREARLPDVLRSDRLQSHLDRWRRGRLPRSRQLMTLFVLESWLRGPQVSGQSEYLGEAGD